MKNFLINKKKTALVFLIIFLLIIFSLNSTAQNLKIHFIDVGQGDSILIENPGGENILVDGGDRADRIAAEIINYLKDRKIKKLDYIISTHPHADHIGGLADIIDNFEVEKVLDSGKIHSSKTYENYLIKIDQKNIDFDTPRQGDKIELGESKIIFLHPDQALKDYSLNNSSLVFVLKYKEQNFLLTGDIENEIEKELLRENQNLKADLIKVPHHGSDSSSYAPWIKNLNTKIAVIQVGAENHYGHPSQKIIDLYQKMGARIYRNDLNGNIVITADGKNLAVKIDKSSANSKKETEKIAPKNNNNEKKQKQGLININNADAQTLDQLWGIGPATAENIINYRKSKGPFKTVAEIMDVNNIGDDKFERWHEKITVN